MDGSFDDEEIRKLVSVSAAPNLNERAIAALFQALSEFQSVRERGGTDSVLAEYSRLERS